MNEHAKSPTNEFPIHGDGTNNTSRGVAEVWVENGTVNITLPDRFGVPGAMVNLTVGDAETLATELDRVLPAA